MSDRMKAGYQPGALERTFMTLLRRRRRTRREATRWVRMPPVARRRAWVEVARAIELAQADGPVSERGYDHA